jgi:CHAT domain-containing protein
VLASLWRVDDRATAALMARFYHALWAEQKPPLQALRQAQLVLYYHPELIPALAGERGPPAQRQAVTLPAPTGQAPAAGAGRAPTFLWAAFLLSGRGQ